MNRTDLTVRGMSCSGCEQRIAVGLGRLDGVAHVEADHRAGTVIVDHDAAMIDEASISRRLADAGYETAATGAER